MNNSLDHTYSLIGLIGNSNSIRGVYDKIELYASVDTPVVITGETGTGKELVARALHQRSPRRMMPFVAVNCSALSEELFESELFGHERGSFTGAVKTHRGRFERADKGTLFLDEIGDMPLSVQAKLLRVLEEGMIERVGGEAGYPVDVRIIAATNIPLEQSVGMRHFRADLYHRIAVLRIHIPPLRARLEDIASLVAHFLKVLNLRYNRQVLSLTPDALRLLEDYHWPGNVRELRNVLERVYVETGAKVIGRNAFNEWVQERDYFAAGEWNLYQWENQKAARPAIIVPHYPDNLRLPNQGGQNQTVERNQPVDQYPQRVALLPFHADTPKLLEDGNKGQAQFISPSLPMVINNIESMASKKNPQPSDTFYTQSKAASTRPKELSRELIIQAFQSAEGNITLAARLLGVHKATFYRHMKILGLTREILNTQIQG